MMTPNKTTEIPLTHDLVEAIGSFPVQRDVFHSGTTFQVSPLDIYTSCPVCKTRIKVRSFSASPEMEDVLDAVIAWMLQPGAEEVVRRRQAEMAADAD
jgi:hypothetical protein